MIVLLLQRITFRRNNREFRVRISSKSKMFSTVVNLERYAFCSLNSSNIYIIHLMCETEYTYFLLYIIIFYGYYAILRIMALQLFYIFTSRLFTHIMCCLISLVLPFCMYFYAFACF